MLVKASDFVSMVEKAYDEKWGYIWATAGELWTEKKQSNLVKKYSSDKDKYSNYKLSSEYGGKWIGHTVTDCSGLIKLLKGW